MYNGFTESADRIEARKRRILQDAPRAKRAQETLETLFPGFIHAQRMKRLKRAVNAFQGAAQGTNADMKKALRELRALLARAKEWNP